MDTREHLAKEHGLDARELKARGISDVDAAHARDHDEHAWGFGRVHTEKHARMDLYRAVVESPDGYLYGLGGRS